MLCQRRLRALLHHVRELVRDEAFVSGDLCIRRVREVDVRAARERARTERVGLSRRCGVGMNAYVVEALAKARLEARARRRGQGGAAACRRRWRWWWWCGRCARVRRRQRWWLCRWRLTRAGLDGGFARAFGFVLELFSLRLRQRLGVALLGV